MDVAIIYESMTGTTEQAAFVIKDELYRRDIATRTYKAGHEDPAYLAAADLVIVGTWTDGLILVGQRPAKKKKLLALPSLDGRQVGVYCTYAVNPGRTLDKLEAVVTDLGGNSLGGMAIHRKKVETQAREFTDRLLGLVPR